MKFLAIIEITPQTMIYTFDKETVIDTSGLSLSNKPFLEFFSTHPLPKSEEVIEMWKERHK